MTLISCFNRSAVENIAACLRLQPDKLILLGNREEMEQPAERCQTILRSRGMKVTVELCHIQGMDMARISQVLARILQKETDCVIDLTGGQELVSMAVGAMLAEQKNLPPISVQKFDIPEGLVMDCDGDGKVIPGKEVSLTVEELVTLNGGKLHPESGFIPESCTREDLEPLWEIVSAAPKDWNKNITVLGEFESRSDSKEHIYLPLPYLEKGISNFQEKEALLRKLLAQFDKAGIIQDRSNHYGLDYTYTTPLFRYCTQKAGNVLEVKTLLEARAMKDRGEAFFQECTMSVNIDWDGMVYDPAERIPETRNEIDLILMQGLTPLFISCKNGNIGDDELYKLHTVATRFGGPYAKKMLIATDLDRKSPSANRAFIQRAWDMDIFLVTDAADLTAEDWPEIFRTAML